MSVHRYKRNTLFYKAITVSFTLFYRSIPIDQFNDMWHHSLDVVRTYSWSASYPFQQQEKLQIVKFGPNMYM